MDVVFVQWYVSEGDFVNEGDELFELDTAKANVSVQASESGYIVSLSASPDDEVERGQVVAKIADEPVDVSVLPQEGASMKPAVELTTHESPVESMSRASVEGAGSSSPFVSPKAKRLARDLGIAVPNTSRGQWVTTDTIRSTSQDPSRSSGTAREPALNETTAIRAARRRVMATSSMASWLQAPHASLSTSIAADPRVRTLTVHNLVLASTVALSAVRDINVRWDGQNAVERPGVSVGLLWKTPSGLVLTRVDGNEKAPSDQLKEVDAARSRAQRGVLLPEDHDERSLTVMWIDADSPMTGSSILPHGDSAMIVAVSTSTDLGLTLTVDHRCIDLADAARFLDSVATFLKEKT
ncbi:2-oxo acid dehydrogenase subunit E2 [Microcella humidisoli]|uniref:Dihydrolipoamide acetyltransferase component of pyruvate dehydrogenase complex n=2 Tax=Microcella humidisoli TaxID=2963406 RepID=A0ABY5FZX7_9MICO|nr:2-oxo acid dehydrogenase subunit E2 [Microcella humidisoli]